MERSEAILIDLRGLKCPLPVLKTERRMRDYASKTRFVVLATDPLAAIDLPHFCGENGHLLLAIGCEGGVLRFEIEKV
jgi:tRNA 2-thiouridine synthesizing protein A